MATEDHYASERNYMVETQIERRGIRDQRVLNAMRIVPRHCFVEPEYHALAYTDGPLPISNGQTISQPYIVALMTELMVLEGHERVLEVGTGSGYQAAVLALVAQEVHTIERHVNLADNAAKLLEKLELKNIHVHVGDGTLGFPEFAPYSAIMVTAAAPDVPRVLLDQLVDGGRIVIPVGSRGGQYLERWVRDGKNFRHENIIPVAFVPLIGEHGWRD